MRHSWACSQEAVAWSPALWNLYTCRVCGLLRQSVPDEALNRYKKLFGFPLEGGGVRWQGGKTPPCPIGKVAEKYMLCHTKAGTIEMAPDDPARCRRRGWTYLEGGLPPAAAASRGYALTGWARP